MPLFQCQYCGCAENTACSFQGIRGTESWFKWDGIEDRRGLLLCSACAPPTDSDGEPTGLGVWHGMFDRVYLPKGQFITNREGNLEHRITKETNYKQYALAAE